MTPVANPPATWIDLVPRDREERGRSLPGDRPLTIVAPTELPPFKRCVIITAIVAPVVLTSITGRPSGLVSWHSGSSSCTIGWDSCGRPTAEVSTGGTALMLTGPAPLITGRFARFELLLTDEYAELRCGPDVVDRAPWSGKHLPPEPPGIVVGSRADAVIVGSIFHTEAATGVVDELRLGTADDVSMLIEPCGDLADDIDPIGWLAARVAPDHERPRYHFVPPGHWMNEPHAPIEVDGIHHLFYQANRRGPFWGGIEWGHAISHDLIHWLHRPPAVIPADGSVAPSGVWSGSSVLDDTGDILLYLTAGDAGRNPDQSVAIARPDGAWTWTLDPQPVLEMPAVHPRDPALRLVPGQFRDPFVWREGAEWFMLVGAGIAGRGSTALLYSSHDGAAWTSEPPLLVGDRTAHADTGEMWELPVLLPVTGTDGERRHVLLVSSWWQRPSIGQRANVWHWIGVWDGASRRFTPDRPQPRLVDVGQHFTGPSGYVTGDGRTIVWSIAQDGRPAALQRDTGWAHNAGLPIELGLGPGGTLTMNPIRELATLRSEQLLQMDASTADGIEQIKVGGLQLEIDVSVRCGTNGTVELGIRADASSHIGGVLRISPDAVTLRRPGAASYDRWCPDELHELPLEAPAVVDVRVFVDGSMIEVYVAGNGSLTSRIHGPADADRVTLQVAGTAAIDQLAVWRLDPASDAVDQ